MLILDDPTNHLDLESITALNDGLIASKVHYYSQVMTTSSFKQREPHYRNRTKRHCGRLGSTYDEFLEDEAVQARVDALYN